MNRLELWGGAECTVNRVGDRFGDQLVATGHHDRDSDLALLAGMGLSAVRFPVLWERIAPDDSSRQDWAWTDARLRQLATLGIRPIAGLIHHGSGPRYTSLVEDTFAPGLAAHALAVAQRYPWIEDWTPVNEPLTTARFSALYGHWYPHARDEGAFWTALLNQIDATRLSMRAIRSVNPTARLIQTDDIGRTYATARLVDQAAFDNTRRWMAWDLLCGMVTRDHPLWSRVAQFGLTDRLAQIADDPCPPDIIGLNHYLTSDRFLDHRVQRYPERVRGGNGKVAFADVEAVRALNPAPSGWRSAIADAWDRYRLPIALTEVHNGCTREEQLRWLADTWSIAEDARTAGIDVIAVTTWAMFGNRGWNTLLTDEGLYEPGAFDVSGAQPRATALVKLLESLPSKPVAEPEAPRSDPAFAGAGWWKRDIRLTHPAVSRPAPIREHAGAGRAGEEDAPPLLITGATGTLGRALAAACRLRNLRFVLTSRAGLDLHDADSIDAALDRHRPWAVINASGWVRVDDAEENAAACMMANAGGAVALATACTRRGIPAVNFSSDLVFDGTKGADYHESDAVSPLNVYGVSKARMEAAVAALDGQNLVVRTAAFFSPFDVHNFAVHASRAMERGQRFAAATDSIVSPTYVPDLCSAVLDLLIDGEHGTWHLTNGEAASWADFGRKIAAACDLDPSLIDDVPGQDLGWRARRPAACGLASTRGSLLPPLDDAVNRFAEHMASAAMPA